MKALDTTDLERRLLVLAPTGKEGALARSIFAEAGVESEACRDAEQLLQEARTGVAAVLVAQEALAGEGAEQLAQLIARQPRWSDLPVLVLTEHGADSPQLAGLLAKLGNVTLLERPIRVPALVTAVQTAMRARQRQYQLRAHLVAREREERWRATELAVVQILAHAEGVEETLVDVLRALCETWNRDAGALWIVREQEGVLRCGGFWHSSEVRAAEFAVLTRERSFAPGVGLPGRVWASGEPAWISELARDENFPRWSAAEKGGLASGFAFPIRLGRRIDGVMEFFRMHPEAPDEELMAMMSLIGAHIAQFLDRKRSEESLRQSERNLNDFFDSAALGMHWVGPDGTILRANRAELEMLGYTEEEYLGHHIAEFHVSSEKIEDVLERLEKGETVRDYEAQLRRKDGGICDVLVTSNALRENGRFVHTRCFTRDITASKRMEEELRRSERLYRSIGESIDFGVWVCDARGGPLYASESFLKLIGMTPEESARFGWANALHPDDRQRTSDAWDECVRTGGTLDIEHRYLGVDGRYHPILARGVPVRDEHGRVVLWAGFNLDIGRLKEAERSLREADRRKDEFLATLAHELRNPLAPISNAVQVVRLKGPPDPDLWWARDVIERQIKQLTRLVDDLLDVSRITRGKIELRKEALLLESVVQDAVETSRPLIEAAQHSFDVTLPGEPVRLHADRLRIAQVLSNLLNNAAKYTPEGGKIELVATRRGDSVEIGVRDSGIGISSEALPRIFEMFTQADRAEVRAQGGLGIGLSLVKRFVEMHGGSVAAHSAGPGLGSEFVVRLPVLPAASPIKETSHNGNSVHHAASPNHHRVLVVDDNQDNADSLALLLRSFGNEVRTANDGVHALEAVAAFRPQVVLLDIGLPNMDGYEVARELRRRPEGRDVLLVAMTGWGQEEDRRRSQAAGFDEHFVKPVDLELLRALLESGRVVS